MTSSENARGAGADTRAWSKAARVGAALAATLALAACASYRGAPAAIRPGAAPSASSDICPTPSAISAFNAGIGRPSNLSNRAWRDQIIGQCIALVDSNYRQFLVGLHREEVATNLGFDLTALTLSGLGSVATGKAANNLAAASTGVIGAGTAVNKDVFYQKTVPAIIAQMNANRAEIYTSILTAEKANDETGYTLTDAQHDIHDYFVAGTIDGAVANISASAQQTTDIQKAAVQTLFVATPDDPTLAARKDLISRNIKAIGAAQKGELDKVAAALGVSLSPGETYANERRDILVALAKIRTARDLDAAALALKQQTGKDFAQ